MVGGLDSRSKSAAGLVGGCGRGCGFIRSADYRWQRACGRHFAERQNGGAQELEALSAARRSPPYGYLEGSRNSEKPFSSRAQRT